MSSTTIKVSPTVMKKMQDKYQSSLLSTPAHAVFRAKVQGVTITAYQSGKVLFQGAQHESVAGEWINEDQTHTVTSSKVGAHLPQAISQWTLIGSDEVGNGSYFGPLAVCAVYLETDRQAEVKALGVKDSKLLTDPQIRTIAEQLKANIPYQLSLIQPVTYNQLQAKYNANALKAKAHNHNLKLLIEKLSLKEKESLQGILIDEFAAAKTYYGYLKGYEIPCQDQTYFARKAESIHLAVACASIIARDAFIESLEELGKEFGRALPSGAGHNVDVFASQLVTELGQDVLARTAKLHFANTKKAMELSKKR